MFKAADGIKNPASTWIIKTGRATIQNHYDGLVLLGSAERVTEDDETKTAHDKTKSCKAALDACTTVAAKTKAKSKLDDADKTKKSFRGRSLTMECFATTIANFV